MDFSFVESLLKNGASVKSSDKHGQTIFHEVARSWHTDVAQFLLTQGNVSHAAALMVAFNYYSYHSESYR